LRPATGSVVWVRDDLVGSEHFASAPVPGTTAWIGQATVILEDTLAANVRLGRADATDADVLDAAVSAGLGPVIDAVGLGALLGDGGWGLSTGEARRVAVARAVLSKAQLWILDEPTSHLDPETEETVLDALASASEGATVLVATHSRAVVDRCRAVWRIDDGRVVEIAAPEVVK
jgi:ATP-binding cassette subfamily C protein CydD